VIKCRKDLESVKNRADQVTLNGIIAVCIAVVTAVTKSSKVMLSGRCGRSVKTKQKSWR